MLELNKLYNMDCMEGMKQFPDKYFDLLIADPPYFSGPEKREYYGREESLIGIQRKKYIVDDWKVPSDEDFQELIRVSKHQIILGCNYYNYQFGPGRIVWDKCNDGTSFSDCEIAYCSLHDSVRIFRFMWNGMMQGKSISEGTIQQGNKKLNEKRIHQTQKPVALYKWLLMQYAQKGYKILNPYVGSASDMIACYDMGFDCIGFEINTQRYELAQQRLLEHTAQIRIEDCCEARKAGGSDG